MNWSMFTSKANTYMDRHAKKFRKDIPLCNNITDRINVTKKFIMAWRNLNHLKTGEDSGSGDTSVREHVWYYVEKYSNLGEGTLDQVWDEVSMEYLSKYDEV